MVLGVLAFAPRLARTLGRYPAALDSILDARFLQDLDAESGLLKHLITEVAEAGDFETAMNVVRRVHREQMFRIGVQTLTGRAGAAAAGRAYTALADGAMQALGPVAMAEAVRMGGTMAGGVAVVAMGKAGSREMTAASDLDLITIYDAPLEATSTGRGWSPEVFSFALHPAADRRPVVAYGRGRSV